MRIKMLRNPGGRPDRREGEVYDVDVAEGEAWVAAGLAEAVPETRPQPRPVVERKPRSRTQGES